MIFKKAVVKVPDPQPTRPQAHAESDYKPGTTGPMDIDTARHENKCHHCQQPWEYGHNCEEKRVAQTAYKQRVGGQQRETQIGVNYEELIVGLKDELNVVKKELAEVKDEGN